VEYSNNIRKATEEEHEAAIALMRTFVNPNPCVGIFWYDSVSSELLGISKIETKYLTTESDTITYPKSHRTYWEEQYLKAIAKGKNQSVYYTDDVYAKIPRGSVSIENGVFFINVGNWIDGENIDKDELRELIIDEFDLSEDVNFRYDGQMDIEL
jgi:hypothetical protein